MTKAKSERRRRRPNALEWPATFDWQERLSDRGNPILVRDLQQSMNGLAISRTSAIACLFILVILISFMSGLGGIDDARTADSARDAFRKVWVCLLPVLWFLLPMRAFLSMRVETQGSAAEQLALCDLSPWRILSGKLLGGVVVSSLYLGICSPMLAMATALRGVEPGTFVVTLIGAVAVEAVFISAAIAAAMMTRIDGLRNGALAVVACALSLPTVAAILGLESLLKTIEAMLRASSLALLIWGCLISGFFAVTAIFISLASLAQRNDNHSTALRLIGFLGPLGAASLLAWGPLSLVSHAMAPSPLSLQLVSVPFWFVAVSESSELPLGVARRQPRSVILRLLSLPFLPGGGRGLLYAVLSITSLTATLWFASPATERGSLLIVALYLLLFAAVTARIRVFCDLTEPKAAALRSRVIALLSVLALCFVGWSYNAARGVAIDEWNVVQYFNPFAAFEAMKVHGLTAEHLWTVGSAVAIAAGLSVSLLVRSVRETIEGGEA